MTLIYEPALDQLIALLREGRDFYLRAAQLSADHEVRHAFAGAAALRQMLLHDLVRQHPQIADPQQRSLPLPAALRHAGLTEDFDGRDPGASADALYARSLALRNLVGRCFRDQRSSVARRVLKAAYPLVERELDMLRRLLSRSQAA